MRFGELFVRVTGAGAARLEASDRGLVRVTGPDRVRFLNGMVTNDVAHLAPGELCYAALLDRKGRLQADLWVLSLEGASLLDTAPGTGPVVAEILTKHVIADEVEIALDPQERLVLEGPESRARLERVGVSLPEPGRLREGTWEGASLLFVGRGVLGEEGIQVFGEQDSLASLEGPLALPLLSKEQAEILRVEAFLPRYGVDMTERNLPAEARLEAAISTTKGCYIGQEIEARVRSRGRVKRLLVQIAAERRVRAGAPVSADGVLVGEVTSAVESPVRGALALGYVRAAHAAPGTRVQVDGTPGVVLGPPFEAEAASVTRR